MRLFVECCDVNVFRIDLVSNRLFNYNAPYSPAWTYTAKRIL